MLRKTSYLLLSLAVVSVSAYEFDFSQAINETVEYVQEFESIAKNTTE